MVMERWIVIDPIRKFQRKVSRWDRRWKLEIGYVNMMKFVGIGTNPSSRAELSITSYVSHESRI